MIDNFNLDKRIQPDMTISEFSYIDGLVDVTQFLFSNLRDLLRDEGRSFGIVTSYIKSMLGAYNKFNEDYTNEDDIDTLGRVFYLYKPVILSEYRKLCQKKLSRADSVITLIKRLTDLVLSLEDQDYPHIKEVRTINKVITRLFDNIRNGNKNIALTNLTTNIKKYLKEGAIGKISLYEFSFKDEEQKRINSRNSEAPKDSTKIEDSFNNKVEEIEWIEK